MQNQKKQKETQEKPHVFEPVPRLAREHRSLGERAADYMAEFGGSWTFILLFLVFLLVWIAINFYAVYGLDWDPYPFILLNLILSCLAAIQAPIILMSQNRAAHRDRLKAERDYYVNRKAEREIQNVQMDLDEIKSMIKKMQK
jgi:uncharacterized membrane protein